MTDKERIEELEKQLVELKEKDEEIEKQKRIIGLFKTKNLEELTECKCDNCGFRSLYPIKDCEFVEDLQKEIDYDIEINNILTEQLKTNTHQVCEKIRKFYLQDKIEWYDNTISKRSLDVVLGYIERGEL